MNLSTGEKIMKGQLLILAIAALLPALAVAAQTQQSEIRINVAGTAFTDSDGHDWSADDDQYVSGTSTTKAETDGLDPSDPIEGTDDDDLYVSRRYGTSFAYGIPVTNGTYDVHLHFAEIFWGVTGKGLTPDDGDPAGERVFDVNVEGALVLDDFDLYAEAGAATAIVKTMLGIEVVDGTLDIEFFLNGEGLDNAIVQGIEVLPAETPDPPPPDEPVFESQLVASDPHGNALTLEFGIADDATDGFDPDYDAFLPPPSPGGFDARFTCTAGNADCEDDLHKDYRGPLSEGTSATWRLEFRRQDTEDDFVLDWSGTSFPEGSFRLIDLSGGSIVDVDMTAQESYTVVDPSIETLLIVHSLGGTFDLPIADGWNLIGLPLQVPNGEPQAIFDDPFEPQAGPFSFDGSYALESELQVGTGYWIRFAQSGAQPVSGTDVGVLTLDLDEGWNLIAGPSCVLEASAIGDPDGILVPGTLYGYSNGYSLAAQIEPGRGYWINAGSAGTIEFDCSSAPGKTGAIAASTPETEHFGRLVLSDAAGARQTLLFGGRLQSNDRTSFSLPPRPPGRAFDARFEGDVRLVEAGEATVALQATSYPVTLELDAAPLTRSSRYFVESIVDGRVVAQHDLEIGTPVEIVDSDVHAVRLRSGPVSEPTLPEAVALRGNYPNPFNPSTTLVFDLPAAAEVTVEVFDLLGKRVMALPAKPMRPGPEQHVAIDAGSLASGVYVYSIRAEMASRTVTKTGRMTLLK